MCGVGQVLTLAEISAGTKHGYILGVGLVDNSGTLVTSSIATISSSIATAVSILDDVHSSAAHTIAVSEATPEAQQYIAENLSNSASYTYTASLTTATFVIAMDGYDGAGFTLRNATTAAVTLNLFGTMDRAAAAGSEVYTNINKEVDTAASTAGWSVGSSAAFTFEDVDGVTGFFKSVKVTVAATANMTLSFDYKTKQS